MKFFVEPVRERRNASPEERATMCDLQIMVGESNSCFHLDERVQAVYDSVRVPAVYLAEGIARDWWAIFGSRDRRHPIWPYRTGFILPCLSFSCDGSHFEISSEQSYCDNPGVRFWDAGSEVVPRQDAEGVLVGFVGDVVKLLDGQEIGDSEVGLQWARVQESREDPEENAFCEAAGALGVDPYSIEESDAQFIEKAGGLFDGDRLSDFLSGVRNLDRVRRQEILSEALGTGRVDRESSRLPELRDTAREVGPDLRQRFGGERAWAPGYRCAQAFRKVIGFQPGGYSASMEMIADKLGNGSFGYWPGLSGLVAVVSRSEDVYVHLRGNTSPAGPSENFNFARAIGDAVCFPDDGWSVVNGLPGAERQAMGRAFAAEFLAPADQVLDMQDRGWAVDRIAHVFSVSQEVVERQIENCSRVQQSCVGIG